MGGDGSLAVVDGAIGGGAHVVAGRGGRPGTSKRGGGRGNRGGGDAGGNREGGAGARPATTKAERPKPQAAPELRSQRKHPKEDLQNPEITTPTPNHPNANQQKPHPPQAPKPHNTPNRDNSKISNLSVLLTSLASDQKRLESERQDLRKSIPRNYNSQSDLQEAI